MPTQSRFYEVPELAMLPPTFVDSPSLAFPPDAKVCFFWYRSPFQPVSSSSKGLSILLISLSTLLLPKPCCSPSPIFGLPIRPPLLNPYSPLTLIFSFFPFPQTDLRLDPIPLPRVYIDAPRIGFFGGFFLLHPSLLDRHPHPNIQPYLASCRSYIFRFL